MKYYKTKVKVRSGGSKLKFFIVEDIIQQQKMFTLEKFSCHWFANIEIGQILEAVVCSDGNVLAVLNRVMEETHDNEREFEHKRFR